MIHIFSARGCPYAQRVRALLQHLNLEHELEEVDLARKPPHFLALSPTGRVPLLVDGDLKLYESMVLLQYVAERAGFEGLSSDLGLRARQRLAMLQFDSVIIPAFMKSFREGADVHDEKIDRELSELESTAGHTGEGPSLLAFHIAPFWARWRWLKEGASIFAHFERREALRRWLDAAAALPTVQDTLPGQEETVRLYYERFGPPRSSPRSPSASA